MPLAKAPKQMCAHSTEEGKEITHKSPVPEKKNFNHANKKNTNHSHVNEASRSHFHQPTRTD